MSSKIRNSYFKIYLQIYFTLSRESFGLQTIKLLSRKLYLSVWNSLFFSVQVFDWSIWGKKLMSTGKIICWFIASGGTEENFNCSSSLLIVAYTDVHQHTRCIHACMNHACNYWLLCHLSLYYRQFRCTRYMWGKKLFLTVAFLCLNVGLFFNWVRQRSMLPFSN